MRSRRGAWASINRPLIVTLSAICAATAHAGDPLAFTDVTAHAGIDARFDVPVGILAAPMLAGAAVGDFNRSGFQDVFIVMGGVKPDRLYINNGDGTFTDRAAEWGIDRRHVGAGIAVGDYNNSGFLDVFITSHGSLDGQPDGHILWRNNGDGTFTDVADEAGVRVTSPSRPDGFGAAFGDYNLSGHLDLAVTGWVENSFGNRLFRNNGDGTFTDVTLEALGSDLRQVHGFGPIFIDTDGDHYPELLWTADFGTSRYFINNRDGTFTDATAPSGTGLDSNGMGAAVADISGDGRPDWYVTSIDDPRTGYQFGNMLYLNQGDHAFNEAGAQAGVSAGGWGWGTVIADLNHNTHLDIVATNGWPEEPWIREQTYLYLARGDGAFEERALQTGLHHDSQGRAVVAFDINNNGAVDLLITSFDDKARLFRNDLTVGPGRNYLRVFLNTDDHPRLAPDGYGTRITADVGDRTITRWITGAGGYLSQNELSAHFGLAEAEAVDTLRVHWSSGLTRTIRNVHANQTITVHACLADFTGDGHAGPDDLALFLDAFAAGQRAADIAPPQGTHDIFDVLAFLHALARGCP